MRRQSKRVGLLVGSQPHFSALTISLAVACGVARARCDRACTHLSNLRLSARVRAEQSGSGKPSRSGPWGSRSRAWQQKPPSP
eukprot:4077752-Prymnesium_polylepis.2